MDGHGEEYLLLKWGTLKGWNVTGNKKAKAAIKRYAAEGASMSAMLQKDTPTQKQALCDIIDAINGPITNDWSGEKMSKEQAKEYVLNYGKKP